MTPERTNPTLPSKGRRLCHLLVCMAGWVLFVWWWWIVLGRLDPAHVRFTAVFLTVTLAGVVALTAWWAFHNGRIHRRKRPRTQVPGASFAFERDRLGRPLSFADGLAAIGRARVVQIRLENDGKIYRALGSQGTDGRVPLEVWRPTVAAGAPPATETRS
jgi:hypothetical protein